MYGFNDSGIVELKRELGSYYEFGCAGAQDNNLLLYPFCFLPVYRVHIPNGLDNILFLN